MAEGHAEDARGQAHGAQRRGPTREGEVRNGQKAMQTPQAINGEGLRTAGGEGAHRWLGPPLCHPLGVPPTKIANPGPGNTMGIEGVILNVCMNTNPENLHTIILVCKPQCECMHACVSAAS